MKPSERINQIRDELVTSAGYASQADFRAILQYLDEQHPKDCICLGTHEGECEMKLAPKEEKLGLCYCPEGTTHISPLGSLAKCPNAPKEEKSKEINVCPAHGNKEYKVEAPHYCSAKIGKVCNCVCTCPKEEGEKKCCEHSGWEKLSTGVWRCRTCDIVCEKPLSREELQKLGVVDCHSPKQEKECDCYLHKNQVCDICQVKTPPQDPKQEEFLSNPNLKPAMFAQDSKQEKECGCLCHKGDKLAMKLHKTIGECCPQDSTWEESFRTKWEGGNAEFSQSSLSISTRAMDAMIVDISQLISKEREKGYQEGHWKGVMEGKFEGIGFGKEMALAEVREKILGYDNWTKWERETLSNLLSSLQEKKSNE